MGTFIVQLVIRELCSILLGFLTVNKTSLIAVVRAVVNLVALLGAVDAGAVSTLELIRPTCEQR